MRNVIFASVALTHLVGCAAYKLAPTSNFETKAPMIRAHLGADPQRTISIVKLNEYPEGAHCFEPLLYVLSVGMIPAHCLERYHVGILPPAQAKQDDLKADFEVTAMQGWIALFLPLSSRWRFGYGENVEEEIRGKISVD